MSQYLDDFKGIREQIQNKHFFRALEITTEKLQKYIKTFNIIDLTDKQNNNQFVSFFCPFLTEVTQSVLGQQNRCLFLSSFMENRNESFKKIKIWIGSKSDVFKKDEIYANSGSILSDLQKLTKKSMSFRSIELRLASLLILEKPDAITDREVKSLMKGYQDLFGVPSDSKENLQSALPTADWYRLLKIKKDLANAIKRVVEPDVKKDLANPIKRVIEPDVEPDVKSESRPKKNTKAAQTEPSQFSWTEPAVAFLTDGFCWALDTKAEIEDYHQCHWRPGTTYVLFVATMAGKPCGLAAELRLEKRTFTENDTGNPKPVAGAIYPHPVRAAHLRVGPDFSGAIAKARIAGEFPIPPSFDLRWSISLWDDEETISEEWGKNPLEYSKNNDFLHRLPRGKANLLLLADLQGDSATAAFAIAIRSVKDDRTLRSDMAITAALDGSSKNPVLKPVGLLDEKTAREALGATKIQTVLVAGDQNWKLPKNGGVQVEVGSDVASAFCSFSEMEQLLAQFADRIAGRWDRIRQASSSRGR